MHEAQPLQCGLPVDSLSNMNIDQQINSRGLHPRLRMNRN